MKYRSRVSVLLFVLLFGVLFSPMLDGEDLLAKGIALSVCSLFMWLLCFLIFLKINYTISGYVLVIRMLGCKMATIDIASIRTIRRSYNPLSSPAASLKRLEVKFYHNGKVQTALISPIREEEFLARLKEINPNIEIQVPQTKNILRFWDWDF